MSLLPCLTTKWSHLGLSYREQANCRLCNDWIPSFPSPCPFLLDATTNLGVTGLRYLIVLRPGVASIR